MGKRRIVLGLILMTLVLLIAASWLYVRPSKTLDMNYSEIEWQDKLHQMIETRKPEVEITEAELNQLAKKELVEHIPNAGLPFEVSGAEFQLNDEKLAADVNGAWGPLEFGTRVEYTLEYGDGQLVLTPNTLSIRHISVSPDIVGLDSIAIDLTNYFPDFIKIVDVSFPGKSVNVRLSLDWLEIARYLESL